MVFKKRPSGQQRTWIVAVRFLPSSRSDIEGRLKAINEARAKEYKKPLTLSELVRWVMWEYCKQPNDPRIP